MKFINKKQSGLTLIEIMIAVVISLILLAGVGQIYLSSKKTYRTTDALSRLQENGRFSLDFIVKSIRETDHMGCLYRKSTVFDGVSATNDNVVAGLVNSDTITLISASQDTMNVSSVAAAGASTIALDSASDFEDGDQILISDCEKGQTVTITSISGSTLTIDSPLKQAYSKRATVSKLITTIYSLGINVAGNPALFMDDGSGVARELVEGIEDMQVQFGVDTDSNQVANYYVDPDSVSVSEMNDVVSVKLSLAVRTLTNNVAVQNRVYNGVNDRRISKNYVATVAIRNRLN